MMSDFAPFVGLLKAGEEAKLMLKAEEYYLGGGGWWSISVGDFIKIADGDASFFGVDLDGDADITVLAFYGIKAFKGFVAEFLKVAESLTPPQSAKAHKASSACLPMTLAEGMLVFVREYFGLKSFSEAERVPLSDYIIAKKDAYNKAVYQQAMFR